MGNPAETLLQRIQDAKDLKALNRALADYYQAADSNAKATTTRNAACCDGCSFCCYLRVHVRAQEVFVIVEYVRSHFSAVEQKKLLERLRLHVARTSTMTEFQHETTNVQCPMLDGTKCSIYSVRPLACRAYHSLDVSSCQRSFGNPEDVHETRPQDSRLVYSWQMMVGEANGAYQSLGFDPTVYELGSALLHALENPSSARRWRDKKKAFVISKAA